MSLMEAAMRRAGGGGLDKPVAAFAAAAAAAMVFMMPVAILQNLMIDTGLASVFSPLAPPLGTKARIALALLAAASMFGLALMGMRMLARAGDMFEAEEDEPEERPAPRVRRRDRHPDAPARAPFSVTRDMGEPERRPAAAPVVQPKPKFAERTAPEPQRRRAPLAEIMAAEAKAAPAPEPVAYEQPEEPPRRIKPARQPEPEAAAEPITPVILPDPDPEDEGELLLSTPEPIEDPEPVIEARADAAPMIRPAWIEPPAPRPSTPEQKEQESLTNLLARFERAMERRQGATPVSAPSAEISQDSEADAMDVRLRSALENLKRFAPQRG